VTSPPFPILFIGTDRLSVHCLNELIKHPGLEVKSIITQANKPKGRKMRSLASLVAHRASALSLPFLTPEDLKSNEFLSKVEDTKADWIVLLSYGKILPKKLLSMFPERAINFHASLLPRWRGAAPIQRAIMAGDSHLGMTLQIMNPQLDKGPIISSRSFKMEEEMDAETVFLKMEDLIKDLLPDLIAYMKGFITPKPQGEEQAIYAHKIDKKESRIIWNDPAIKVFNQIRALVMGPQAYAFDPRSKRVKVYKAKYLNKNISQNPPGQVIDIGPDHFKLACYHSILSILKLQPESKKIMSAADYIRGYNIKVGDIFK